MAAVQPPPRWVPKAKLSPMEVERLGFSSWTEEKIEEMQHYRTVALRKQQAIDDKRRAVRQNEAVARAAEERAAAAKAEAARVAAAETNRGRVRRRRPSRPKFSIDLAEARRQFPELTETKRTAKQAEHDAEETLERVRKDIAHLGKRVQGLEEDAAELEVQQEQVLELVAGYRTEAYYDRAGLAVEVGWLADAPSRIEALKTLAKSCVAEEQRLELARLPLMAQIQVIPTRSVGAGKKMAGLSNQVRAMDEDVDRLRREEVRAGEQVLSIKADRPSHTEKRKKWQARVAVSEPKLVSAEERAAELGASAAARVAEAEAFKAESKLRLQAAIHDQHVTGACSRNVAAKHENAKWVLGQLEEKHAIFLRDHRVIAERLAKKAAEDAVIAAQMAAEEAAEVLRLRRKAEARALWEQRQAEAAAAAAAVKAETDELERVGAALVAKFFIGQKVQTLEGLLGTVLITRAKVGERGTAEYIPGARIAVGGGRSLAAVLWRPFQAIEPYLPIGDDATPVSASEIAAKAGLLRAQQAAAAAAARAGEDGPASLGMVSPGAATGDVPRKRPAGAVDVVALRPTTAGGLLERSSLAMAGAPSSLVAQSHYSATQAEDREEELRATYGRGGDGMTKPMAKPALGDMEDLAHSPAAGSRSTIELNRRWSSLTTYYAHGRRPLSNGGATVAGLASGQPQRRASSQSLLASPTQQGLLASASLASGSLDMGGWAAQTAARSPEGVRRRQRRLASAEMSMFGFRAMYGGPARPASSKQRTSLRGTHSRGY